METNERILAIVKEKGPVLPVQVSREINDSILMTSARLSELLSRKQIKISNLKIGSSPLYYFPGQESKLQNFIDNLQGIERKAYDLLEQNKILRDPEQEPAVRVALRQIKDFAVPLQVNYENKTEIFWKWYLIDNKEAESLIKNILSRKQTIPKKALEKPLESTVPKKTLEKSTEETKKEIQEEFKKEIVKKPRKIVDKGIFLRDIHDFFNISKINIIETQETKKSSEFGFVIELQTSIGPIRYFCKSRNKKKISDADLSSAVLQSQTKNLPLLFLTNGELTKKAREMLNNEFKNITFKKIS